MPRALQFMGVILFGDLALGARVWESCVEILRWKSCVENVANVGIPALNCVLEAISIAGNCFCVEFDQILC